MGGGHLMTRAGYDIEHLVSLLRRFKAKYPNLQIILEPGSAFAWRAGYLKSTILDIVENRLVGMKCRGVYETPGGAILYKAHSVLESICLDKLTLHEKQKLAVTFGELVYNGQWFTPLREALSAFVDKTQENVTGKVRLKLYKGNMINAGVWSDYSLYSEQIATFGESDYNQKDAEGFINLYGLPIQVQAMVRDGLL